MLHNIYFLEYDINFDSFDIVSSRYPLCYNKNTGEIFLNINVIHKQEFARWN